MLDYLLLGFAILFPFIVAGAAWFLESYERYDANRILKRGSYPWRNAQDFEERYGVTAVGGFRRRTVCRLGLCNCYTNRDNEDPIVPVGVHLTPLQYKMVPKIHWTPDDSEPARPRKARYVIKECP
jgi:hypothetical protein